MEDFFFSFVSQWSYFGLVLVLLAAGFGLPLPEDIPLLAAGWLVQKGGADLRLMIFCGLFGVILGDTTLFVLGRRYGMHVLDHRLFRRFARPWMVARAREMYAGHGAKILFAARFMPGLRSIVFLNAGVFRVPYWKFLVFDGGAALISVPLWILAGWKFSAHIEQLLGSARLASYIIGTVLALALLAWGLWEYYHYYRKRNGGKKAEAPIVRSAPLVQPERGRSLTPGRVERNLVEAGSLTPSSADPNRPEAAQHF